MNSHNLSANINFSYNQDETVFYHSSKSSVSEKATAAKSFHENGQDYDDFESIEANRSYAKARNKLNPQENKTVNRNDSFSDLKSEDAFCKKSSVDEFFNKDREILLGFEEETPKTIDEVKESFNSVFRFIHETYRNDPEGMRKDFNGVIVKYIFVDL